MMHCIICRVVRLWQRKCHESIAALGRAPAGGPGGGYAPVTTLDFSRSGHLLAAGYSNFFHVRVWSVATLACVGLLKGHTSHTMSVKFAPHVEDLLATANCDGTLRLWCARKQTCYAVVDHRGSMLFAVAWDSSGSLVATGGNDGCCRVWQTDDLKGNRRSFAVSDGNSTAAALQALHSAEGKVTAKTRYSFRESSAICALSFSGDGSVIATGSFDGKLRMWSIQGLMEPNAAKLAAVVDAHAKPILSLAFYANSRVATGGDDKVVRLWDLV